MVSPRVPRRRTSAARILLLGFLAAITAAGVAFQRRSAAREVNSQALVKALRAEKPNDHAKDFEEDGSQCESVVSNTLAAEQKRVNHWRKLASQGRIIAGFGEKASQLLIHARSSFDRNAVDAGISPEACAQERELVESQLQQGLRTVFLLQHLTVEEMLCQRLRKDLLRKMWWKKRDLDVTEKLRLLHSVTKQYKTKVQDLQPSFVEDSESAHAEKRLSELQWGIGDTPEAKEMKQRWKLERMRQSPIRHRGGISVSLSPGLRLMLRPQGFGNIEFWSRRQVGQPQNPSEVSIGIVNDGLIGDIYNKKPRPPVVKLQPAVGVEFKLN